LNVLIDELGELDELDELDELNEVSLMIVSAIVVLDYIIVIALYNHAKIIKIKAYYSCNLNP
jgi:hypothetical protein